MNTTRPLGRCAGTWRCPLCHLFGQTWAGHERDTDLAAHMRIVHGGPDPRRPLGPLPPVVGPA